ncbi:MAG: c-type cytochrome [Chloroflexota bacterium]
MRLDQLLIKTTETRILVGLVTFVATMVVVGWVGINEPARMETFADQFEGRSIERGAKLFNANCSSCHGVDGLGQVGVAPGLNNPQMFGYNPFAAIDREQEQLEFELGTEVTAERETEIQVRLDELASERNALETQLADAIAAGYDVETTERMDQAGWSGSIRSYVLTTLVHGRPGSQNYWPSGQGMAAWGQTSGGPLRQDQLENLTDYIMNWDKGNAWTIDDFNAVNQYAILPADPSMVVTDPDAVTVGVDVEAIVAELVNYEGDPVIGEQLYTAYACVGCHLGGAVAPATEAQWALVVSGADGRPHSDDPVRYFVESIVAPNAYVVPGYAAGAMPANFGERMTFQEMADVIAYVEQQGT